MLSDVGRFCDSTRHDAGPLVQEAAGKNSRYLVTTGIDTGLRRTSCWRQAQGSSDLSLHAVGSPGQYMLLMTLCNVRVIAILCRV